MDAVEAGFWMSLTMMCVAMVACAYSTIIHDLKSVGLSALWSMAFVITTIVMDKKMAKKWM